MPEIDSVRIHDFLLFSDLLPCSARDYDHARTKYIGHLVDRVQPLAVYEYGSVSVPGISDVDLLVVTNPDRRPARTTVPKLEPTDRYLIDKPIVLTPHLFGALRFLVPIDPLEHLWGRRYAIHDLSSDVQKVINAAILMDFGQILLHRFIKINLRRRIGVRDALLRLNSVGHSVALARACGVHPMQRALSFVSMVRGLRERWLDTQDYDTLVELLQLAIPVLLDLFEGLADAAVASGWYRVESSDTAPVHVQVAPASFTLFASDFRRFYEAEFKQGFGGPAISTRANTFNISLSVACLPMFAYRHLQVCARGTGPVRRAVQHRCDTDLDGNSLDGTYSSVVSRRMHFANVHWEYLNACGLLELGQFPTYGIARELVRPTSLRSMLTRYLAAWPLSSASRLILKRRLNSYCRSLKAYE